QVLVERQCFSRRLLRPAPSFNRRNVAAHPESHVGVCQAREGESVIVVLFNRLLAILDRRQKILPGPGAGVRTSLHVVLERLKVFGWPPRELLSPARPQTQLLGNLPRDLLLHGEDVQQLTVVLLSPELRAI